MAEIILKDICKSFGETKVVKHVDLTIEDGAFSVIVGPSGCGKSTICLLYTSDAADEL